MVLPTVKLGPYLLGEDAQVEHGPSADPNPEGGVQSHPISNLQI